FYHWTRDLSGPVLSWVSTHQRRVGAPVAPALHRQQCEQGVQGGGEVQRFVEEQADEDDVEHDPQWPALHALLRHPYLRHQAVAGQCSVEPGLRGVSEVRHGRAQHCADHRPGQQAEQQAAATQRRDCAAAVRCAASSPLPPSIQLQGGVDHLQEHVGVELYVKKDPGVQQHHDQADGPAPWVLFDCQPHGDDTDGSYISREPCHEQVPAGGMMDLWTAIQALILGVVEGLTEFLPISSTGHQIIVADLIGFGGQRAMAFNIIIQLGAILAVMWEFRRKILDVVTGLPTRPEARRFTANLIVGVLPAMVLGVLFSDLIHEYLFNPITVAVALVVGGFIMLWAENRQHVIHAETVDEMTWVDALKVGFAHSAGSIGPACRAEGEMTLRSDPQHAGRTAAGRPAAVRFLKLKLLALLLLCALPVYGVATNWSGGGTGAARRPTYAGEVITRGRIARRLARGVAGTASVPPQNPQILLPTGVLADRSAASAVLDGPSTVWR
nr:hypothetical protein [Tanacetum cinerariifolium]